MRLRQVSADAGPTRSQRGFRSCSPESTPGLASAPGTHKQARIVHRSSRRGGLDDPRSSGNTALGAVRQCGSGRSLGLGPPSLYGPGLRQPLRPVRSNSNPAATSSPEQQATQSPDRQHRFRAETTPGLGAVLRDIRAPATQTTLGNNDRPRAFPDRRPEIHNYPLGKPPTPLSKRISSVPTATALNSPTGRSKSRSPNMRGSTSPPTPEHGWLH